MILKAHRVKLLTKMVAMSFATSPRHVNPLTPSDSNDLAKKLKYFPYKFENRKEIIG